MAVSSSQNRTTQPAGDDEPQLDRASFLLVECASCEREVLSHADLGPDGQLIRVCVHCERPLDADHPSARWLDADALAERGYLVDGRDSPDERHGGRGCRGGSCGIRQPDQ